MNRKRTQDRQAEIVDAAMRIIAQKGAKKFTAQLVADEVGITAGAIFRHFNNMEEIVDAVIDRTESILFEGFPPGGAAPLGRLEEFFRKRISVVAGNADLSKLLLSDHVADLGGDGPAARVLEFRRRSQRFVRKCLKEASDAQAISRSANQEAAAVIILGSIMMVGLSAGRPSSKGAVEKLSNDVWASILVMLRPASPTKTKGNKK